MVAFAGSCNTKKRCSGSGSSFGSASRAAPSLSFRKFSSFICSTALRQQAAEDKMTATQICVHLYHSASHIGPQGRWWPRSFLTSVPLTRRTTSTDLWRGYHYETVRTWRWSHDTSLDSRVWEEKHQTCARREATFWLHPHPKAGALPH